MTQPPLPSPQARGWIGRRDPRLRLLAALLFALVTVSLERPAIAALALGLALALAFAAGLKPRDLARRLLALEGFMLILMLSLPFTTPGPPLFSLGPVTASGVGIILALMILLKANAVVLVLLALPGTLEPVVLGHALARIGVPEKLAHLLLMTVRQIHLLHQEFLRLRQAMRARAFVPRANPHTWRTYGWLMGMLLVRSLARGERLMGAMRCRCFHGRLYLLDTTRWNRGDTLASLGLIPLLLSLPLLDRLG
ncbi:cobalt ECF transporter T component CbiQ [Thiocystis violacea]|uniref:cobalt ECF transporter T component CbiQ n=1 Tax=Thiocystis violacea TaxID=13725 RepID=UPI001905AE53|nr:cobalt ECF transporter T component CbiQ [Thiocystis violacea]MBK1718267.1 cobalt ECF transporter T component CbiQ [Thiocystis violacea]